jgi:hypothetical protein
MSAINYPLEIEQGANYIEEFQFIYAGVPAIFTNYSIRGEIKHTKISTSVLANLIGLVVDDTNGKISIALSNADRDALNFGTYYFKVEGYTATDAIIARLLEGPVVIK